MGKMDYLDLPVQNALGGYIEPRDYFQSIGRKSQDSKSRSASLKAFVVTSTLQRSYLGEKFRLFNSEQDENYRVIYKTTRENLRRLLDAKQWLCYAKFRSAHKIFRQLWPIND